MRNIAGLIHHAPRFMVLAIAVAGLCASSSAFARGGGHSGGGGHVSGGHGGRGHYGGRGWYGGLGWAGGGLGFGYGALWDYSDYDYPYGYSGPLPLAPIPGVIPQNPPQTAPAGQVYYFCDNPNGYYPYVTTCQTPWRSVPVVPPR